MHFLSSLDTILNRLYNNSLNIIICGDFNINYLKNSNNKLQLDSLLASCNLHSVVDFSTRITTSSCTTIDNIFINKHISIDFSIQSYPTRLSDHDVQIITLTNIKIQKPSTHHLTRRVINDTTVSEFQLNLSYESWDNVFNGDDVDTIFNNFLNTYLRIFYHTFALKKCQNNYNNKQWKTPGIIISSQHKRDLYLLCRSIKDSKLNNYKKYCRILSDVVRTAKRKYYNNLLINSNNRSKTSWHIIKSVTNKTKRNHSISSIETDEKVCNDCFDIAKAFNKYFTTVTKNIFVNNSVYTPSTPNNVCPLNYLKQIFARPFPRINYTPTTTKEITEIVKSLKSTNSHGYDEIPTKVLNLVCLL